MKIASVEFEIYAENDELNRDDYWSACNEICNEINKLSKCISVYFIVDRIGSNMFYIKSEYDSVYSLQSFITTVKKIINERAL